MGYFTSFLYSQLFIIPPPPTKSFPGQTVIVTGSNTGLGLEAARHISRLNASLLILAVRNTTKGEVARSSILASTGRPEESIEVWELDMQSTSSILAFSVRARELKRLDAVILNAGIGTKEFRLVNEYESMIMTNVIEVVGSPGRMSIVSSGVHNLAKFPERYAEDVFEALNQEERGTKTDLSVEGYATSKLLQILFARELASRINALSPTSPSPSVIINSLTPGVCKSDFFREMKGMTWLTHIIFDTVIARTTEVGSRTLVAGLVAGQESHGGYMADGVLARPGPMVTGDEGEGLQKKLWLQLMRQLEGIQPGISKNI